MTEPPKKSTLEPKLASSDRASKIQDARVTMEIDATDVFGTPNTPGAVPTVDEIDLGLLDLNASSPADFGRQEATRSAQIHAISTPVASAPEEIKTKPNEKESDEDDESDFGTEFLAADRHTPRTGTVVGRRLSFGEPLPTRPAGVVGVEPIVARPETSTPVYGAKLVSQDAETNISFLGDQAETLPGADPLNIADAYRAPAVNLDDAPAVRGARPDNERLPSAESWEDVITRSGDGVPSAVQPAADSAEQSPSDVEDLIRAYLSPDTRDKKPSGATTVDEAIDDDLKRLLQDYLGE